MDIFFDEKKFTIRRYIIFPNTALFEIMHVFSTVCMSIFLFLYLAYGVWTDKTTTYINASTCTLRYAPKNKPIVVDLLPK